MSEVGDRIYPARFWIESVNDRSPGYYQGSGINQSDLISGFL